MDYKEIDEIVSSPEYTAMMSKATMWSRLLGQTIRIDIDSLKLEIWDADLSQWVSIDEDRSMGI